MRFELCPVRMEELKQYKLDMQEAFQKGFENKYGKKCFYIGTIKDPQEESKKHGQNYFS